jgi:hypothetical protein
MVKHRKKTTRTRTPVTDPPDVGDLKERLKQLSRDQLADIIERFFAQLNDKQRLEFLNLLPTTRSEDLESQLPYSRDEDFLSEIEDFCDRVRNEEFVKYGAGFDPDEGEYHGFGDDSWIDEMDELFDAAEVYFLARHYGTAEKAYQMLFDCLEIESREGGYYFTTSDPQAALSTDLIKARDHYFHSLCHLYRGETLAGKIIDGLREYCYIGNKSPDLKELFPDGGDVIGLLEEELIKMPSRDDPNTILTALDQPAELLRQIYTNFRSLEELERFTQQHGKKHPWAYEDLVRAYAEKEDWQKVLYWANQGLSSRASKKKSRNAILGDYKAQAAQELGDPAALSALWEAFDNETSLERYLSLRKAAKTQGQWDKYYPRLIQRLTHNISGDSVLVGHLWDNRLLVEALLVEGEYDRAVEQAAYPRFLSFEDERGDARKSVVDFLLHSVTRTTSKDACAAQYPEITKQLNKPSDFIRQLKEELFQDSLSESDRNRQIDWIVQILKLRINQIVSNKWQHAYADAARNARLIEELYRFQGRIDKAQSFITSLHTQYQRYRNFRAELRKLGLNLS